MSAREERLVTADNLWELDTWLDKVDVFAKPHFDYVNSELVNTGIKFGNAPTRMTAFIGDTIVRHEDGSHTVLSAKDTAELDKLRVQVAEVCGQRDAWHDWADTLAYKVAPVEVLGKHGDEGKFPWDDALKLITPAAEVDALRARIAELEQSLKRRTSLLRDVQKIARKRTNESRGRREYGAKLKARVAELEALPDRAAVLREAADAIVADNDRQMWATKPGKHWAADLLRRMADGKPQRQQEDPHDGPLSSRYAVPHDLPPIPHQRDEEAL